MFSCAGGMNVRMGGGVVAVATDVGPHGGVEAFAFVGAGGNGAAYVGGTHVEERSADGGDAGGQCLGIQLVARAGKDEEAVVAQDVFGPVPAMKGEPVVCPDDEDELAIRPGGAQGFERVHHVRGAG